MLRNNKLDQSSHSEMISKTKKRNIKRAPAVAVNTSDHKYRLRAVLQSIFYMASVTLIALLLMFNNARADEIKYPVVLELFTSQGCSSCPPADKLLESYKKKKDVITLSYSVDYWDYLGWRDTFGSKANSQRQRDYARSRKDSQVYTPQMVINGLAHANGSIRYSIDDHIVKTTKKLQGHRLALRVEANGDNYIVTTGDATKSKGATLWMVRVQDQAIVDIRRGENHGRKLTYHNIVRGMKKLGTIGDAPLTLSLKRSDLFAKKGEHCVLLLQRDLTGPILAAAELRP